MAELAYRLAAMGDIMLDRTIGRHYRSRPQDYALDDVAQVLRGYDLVFANLENPVGVAGTPHRIQHPNVTFCAHPDTLQVLKNLGVGVVSLGNNHMLDYGPVSLVETLDCLDAWGIRHVGAGRNYEEANRPLLLEVRGRKVAILSYVFLYSASTEMATATSPGVSDHRMKNVLPRIRTLADAGYDVLVSAHWGLEYSFYPLLHQMREARQMIDAGARVIIGHGPHFPQGIEEYGSGQIVYSLGNFIFDEPHTFANRSFIYGVDVASDGSPGRSRIYPTRIVDGIPKLEIGRPAERMSALISILSGLYARLGPGFWRQQSSRYLSDIVHRVTYMKSLKFVWLPPVRFYRDVGVRNYCRKLVPPRVRRMLAG